jgi:hypothetical protein
MAKAMATSAANPTQVLCRCLIRSRAYPTNAGQETAAISLDRECSRAQSPMRTERSRCNSVAWSL